MLVIASNKPCKMQANEKVKWEALLPLPQKKLKRVKAKHPKRDQKRVERVEKVRTK